MRVANPESYDADTVIWARDLPVGQVERGQVVAKPASISAHTTFEARIYMLTREEGGREKPLFSNDRPQFFFRKIDIAGTAALLDGVEMAMPGDTLRMAIELVQPVAIEEHERFAVREDGRTIGAGVVIKVVE